MDLKNASNKRKKVNRAEIAYITIKKNILNHTIKPGDYLSEGSIASELSMSRTPVREALKMLANEDFVEIRNGVGVYVKTMSFKDILDIFEVRKNLETLAVETSIRHISKDELERLENELNGLLGRFREGENINTDEFNKIDVEIHHLFINKSDNKYIISFMDEINFRISSYQFLSLSELGNMEESIIQHIDLIKIAKQGDVNRLKEELTKHIDWALDIIIKRKNE